MPPKRRRSKSPAHGGAGSGDMRPLTGAEKDDVVLHVAADGGYGIRKPNGTEEWRDITGKLHRDNGLPAVITSDIIVFYNHGVRYGERKIRTFSPLGTPSSTACTKYAITQVMGTCYIAAAVNLLLCTPVFRHFLKLVLNRKLIDLKHETPAARDRFLGNISSSLPLPDLVLQIVHKIVCGADGTVTRHSHSLDTIIGRAVYRKEVDFSRLDGGYADNVLAALLQSFGLQHAHVAMSAWHQSTKDNAGKPWDVLVQAPPQSRKDRDMVPSVEDRAGNRYALVGCLISVDDSIQDGGHVMAGLLCLDGKAIIFDSNDDIYDIDWRESWSMINKGMNALADWNTPEVLDRRGVYVSEAWKARFTRDPRCGTQRAVDIDPSVVQAPVHKPVKAPIRWQDYDRLARWGF